EALTDRARDRTSPPTSFSYFGHLIQGRSASSQCLPKANGPSGARDPTCPEGPGALARKSIMGLRDSIVPLVATVCLLGTSSITARAQTLEGRLDSTASDTGGSNPSEPSSAGDE